MPNIEEHLRQAIAAGKFDNLPGKGQPLRWEDDSLVDPEWRLAYKMLKDGGFTLPWIETRREIEDDLAAARAALQRAWRARQAAQAEPEWQRAQAAFRAAVEQLNQRIQKYNLEVPLARFQRGRVDGEAEIKSLI
jgi:DnaJ family protein C protein 28